MRREAVRQRWACRYSAHLTPILRLAPELSLMARLALQRGCRGFVRFLTAFPGLEAAFACDWPPESGWSSQIDVASLGEALLQMDPHRRSFDVCNLYLDAIRLAAQRDDRLSVLI